MQGGPPRIGLAATTSVRDARVSLVDLSDSLRSDLRSLTAALATPDADLESSLTSLLAHVRFAVPSCSGVALEVTVHGRRVTLSTVDDQSVVVTSLRVPLSAEPSRDAAAVTFYASAPGALVDLAATARFLRPGHGPPGLLVDGDLSPDRTAGMRGLESLAVIDQAIGILVDQGFEPEEASVELDRRAAQSGVTRMAAARRIYRRRG